MFIGGEPLVILAHILKMMLLQLRLRDEVRDRCETRNKVIFNVALQTAIWCCNKSIKHIQTN